MERLLSGVPVSAGAHDPTFITTLTRAKDELWSLTHRRISKRFQASQPDELTIEEQEILEVIDDGDMEDWLKVGSTRPEQKFDMQLNPRMLPFQARNGSGQVGYVPEKYLQLASSTSLLSMLQALAALDARSHSSSSNSAELDAELQPGDSSGETRSAGPTQASEPPGQSSACAAASFAKALYDYSGQTQEELSFPEGAIIRILSRDTREDDGFWEGDFNGLVGVFPAVLVEDLSGRENGGGLNASTHVSLPLSQAVDTRLLPTLT